LQLSAFTQSGITFCFPLSDPQLPPSVFPARAPFSLSQQSMTATWRACSSDRLRVFLHVCAGDHRPLGHPLCLQALTRVYKYRGQLVDYLPVPFVAPASASSSFFLLLPLPSSLVAPPLLEPRRSIALDPFLSPHTSVRCIRASLTLAGSLSSKTAGIFICFTGPLFFTGESLFLVSVVAVTGALC
jgi:hypothetical protein